MFEDVDTDYEESPPPEESDNRTFLIAAGVLGGITVLALICMAAYVLLIAPGQRNARFEELTAIAAQNTEAAMVARAQTQTARAPTATTVPTSTGTPTSSPTPVVVQATATRSVTLETTDDLTPEIIAGIAASLPQLLDDLTDQMLLAMRADLIEALPQSFLDGLDADLRAQLEARMNPPNPNPAPVDLPQSWIDAAAGGGETVATTGDLTVQIVLDNGLFEGVLLDALTPEILLALPMDVLEELPDDYVAGLEPLVKAQLDLLLNPPDSETVDLPGSWGEAAVQLTAAPTVGPRTATVAALLTQAAQQTSTFVPTATALPGTGFADEVGVPSLLALAVLFVVVIFLARRLRKANA